MSTFKFPELSEEDRARIDQRQAEEAAEAMAKEEVYRRRWCVECAVSMHDGVHPENVIRTAERLYDYVYGRRDA